MQKRFSWEHGSVVLALAGVGLCTAACNTGGGTRDVATGENRIGGDEETTGDGASAPFETVVDERGLVTTITRGGRQLRLAWSAEGSSADVTFENDGTTTEFSITVGFEDEALLEAFAFIEQELGTDLTDLREWVSTNPGAVAAGVADASQTTARRAQIAKLGSRLQADLPGVEEHLDGLRSNLAKLAQVVYRLGLTSLQASQEPEEVQSEYRQAFELARDQWQDAREEQQLQERECALCTLACEADCATPNQGSCCRYAAGRSQCLPADAKSCSDDGGFFFEGLSCGDVQCPEAGACCTSIDCLDTNGTVCDLIGGKFDEGESCLDAPCDPGACYTLYQTSLGDACCDCRTATDNECRALSNFHFFVRNEECPGACYVGEGDGAYCYEDSESECLRNEGAAFFHESVCAGICVYESGCTAADTRQCDELEGDMYYHVDSCVGSCDYYDLNALEDRCVGTGGPAECDALGGGFFLGEACP
ncbi:MAG: hypothetical protein HY763_09420 [Planctomycetes bacterium]|nr:hypothetical protein [Planctomycetota bacterium]